MKVEITHNIGDVAKQIAAAPEAVLKEVDRALFRGAIEVADEVRRQAPKARSELTNSTQVKAKPLEYTIAVLARYAGWVHQGTGAGGRPPLKEMLDWIRLKRITPRDPRMSERTLARTLRWHIQQRGIQANPFAERAFDAKRSRLAELIESAAQRGAASAAGDHR